MLRFVDERPEDAGHALEGEWNVGPRQQCQAVQRKFQPLHSDILNAAFPQQFSAKVTFDCLKIGSQTRTAIFETVLSTPFSLVHRVERAANHSQHGIL